MSEQDGTARKRQQKRGNVYTDFVWTRDAKTGKRHHQRISAPTVRELKETKRALQAKNDARKWRAPDRTPLGTYLQDYLDAVSVLSRRGHALAPTTRQKYGDAIDRIEAEIGHVPLCDLQEGHVEQLREALLKKKLAPGTVNDVMRILGQACRRAVVKGLLEYNPADADRVPRPSHDPKKFVVIGPQLAQRILEAGKGLDPWDAALNLALGCGLRREEVLGLRWSHVDFDAGTIRVTETVTWAGGRFHQGPTKTKASVRTVPMPTQVADALKRHRKAQARIGSDGLVIDNGRGGPWSPPTFSTYWRRFAKQHDLRGRTLDGTERVITFHTLRHGAATLLMAGQVSDAMAMRILGHTTVKMLDRYRDPVTELLQDAGQRMSAMLGGGS
jgi:integrase